MKPHKDTIETLRLFGRASLRNEQIKPIEALRKCKNVFVNAPTSSGKSLIYQLPAVLHPLVLLVLVLPALVGMKDKIGSVRYLLKSLFQHSCYHAQDRSIRDRIAN